MSVLKGEDAKLECKILEGNPPPVVKWFKMGKKLGGGKRVEDNGLGKLWIRGVVDGDEGDYSCVAHNVAGNASLTIPLHLLSNHFLHTSNLKLILNQIIICSSLFKK